MAITRHTDPNGGTYAIKTSSKIFSPYFFWGPEGITYSTFLLKGGSETCRFCEIFKKGYGPSILKLDWGSDNTIRLVAESGTYQTLAIVANSGWALCFVKLYKNIYGDRLAIYLGDSEPDGYSKWDIDMGINPLLYGFGDSTELRFAVGTVGTFFDITIWDKLLPQSLIEFKFNKNFTTLPPV